MSRSRMTMRAAVERDGASGEDAYGHPPAPSFAAHGTFACYVWSKARRDVVDGDKQALVEDMRAIFPLGTDIAEGDEISSIADRRGTELYAGRFAIDTVQRKPSHLEAALRKVS